MPGFSDNLKEQVRAASDIVEVIGAYIPLKKAGANFVALCPFHREKTPSFNVNPQRQIFRCFGCGKGGDVFRFVMDYEGLTFPEALRRLAERAGLRIEADENPAAAEQRGLKERLRELHEQLCRRWQQMLTQDAAGQPGRDYLARRGVGDEAVARFRLGYAPDRWDDTLNWGRGKGWDAAFLEQAGVVVTREPEEGGPARTYDRFRGRLMFPICDEQGRVIAFSGRVLDPEAKAAKYVNSPETPLFTKGRVLYALDRAKRAILDAGHAVVCEGQLDTIACHLAGVENAVAPQGTAFTGEHARILKRYAAEVILCFDADAAGQKAAARALDDLLASGLGIRVATLPAPHDPDSFIREQGAEAFRARLAGAVDFFEFHLRHLCATHDVRTDSGQRAVAAAMADALHKAGRPLLLERYAQRTAIALSAGAGVPLSADAVRAEFRRAARPPSSAGEPEAGGHDDTGEPPAEPPPPANEQWLLKLALLDAENAGWLALHLDPAWVTHPRVRELLQRRLEAQQADTWTGVSAWLGQLADPADVALVTGATVEARRVPHQRQQLADLVRELRNAWLSRRIAALSARLADPDFPEGEKPALLADLQRCQALKRVPLPLLAGAGG